MTTTKNRKNDLYARDMPTAKAIEEIKHLARVKKVKVGMIVHREHAFVSALRDAVADPTLSFIDADEVRKDLNRLGLVIR